jgi:hypothetical protein
MKERVAVMPPDASANVVRCTSCSRTWPLEAWRALPTMATLTASKLRDYVSAWPADTVVEVRACLGCGRAIARRTAVPRETAA